MEALVVGWGTSSSQSPWGRPAGLQITQRATRSRPAAHGTCQAWLGGELETGISRCLFVDKQGCRWWQGGAAHRDQQAMQISVLRLGVALRLGGFSQQLFQAAHAGHPNDIDVIVAAKRLDEGEVDLQSDVILLLFVDGQETQDHAVGVPERGERGGGDGSAGKKRRPGEGRGGEGVHLQE